MIRRLVTAINPDDVKQKKIKRGNIPSGDINTILSEQTRKQCKKRLIHIIYVTLFMLGIYVSFYQLMIFDVSKMFLLDGTMMGLAIGVQSAGMAISPLILGVLCERIGKKRIILIAYSLMITGTGLAGTARVFLVFLMASFLIGAGFSILEATLSAVLADEFQSISVRHLNFSQAAFSIGALCSPLLTAAVTHTGICFQDLYFSISAVFIVLGALFVFVPLGKDSETHDQGEILFYFTSFFNNKILLLLAAAIFFYVGIENSAANFMSAYFSTSVDMAKLGAPALSIFWGAMIPSRYLAGTLKWNVKAIFFTSCIFTAFSLIAAMLMVNPLLKLAMFALCGFGCGPVWPLLMNQAAKSNKGSSGTVMNIMFSFCATGGAILPFFAGMISDMSEVSGVYYFCACATAATAFLWDKAIRTAAASKPYPKSG